MSDPSWLQDDDPLQSPTSLNRPTSPSAIPKAPTTPKPNSISPSRKAVQQKNAQLEQAGLEFLQTDVAESTPQVVKETKSGVLIVDEDLAPSPAGAKGQATGAPVHFLKRMREAEEKRLQRLEKIAAGAKEEDKAGTPSNGLRKKVGITRPPTGGGKRSGSRPGSATPFNNTLNSSTSALNSARVGSGGAAIGADGGIIETEVVDLSIVPPLNDDDKADYAVSIAQFGEDVIRKLRSNRYQHRVEALKLIKEAILTKKHLQDDDELNAYGEGGGDAVDVSDDEDEFGVKKVRTDEQIAAKQKLRKEREDRKQQTKPVHQNKEGEVVLTVSMSGSSDASRLIAMVEVLGVALKDSLFHVVIAACDLLDGILEDYAFLDKDFVDDHLKSTITALITRLKDSNARTKDTAAATLLNLSAHANVGPSAVVRLVAKSVPMPAGADSTEAVVSHGPRDDWKYTVAKIDLCHSILDAKPRYISSLSDDCLRIATHGLGSANPQARKRAAAFFGLVRGECGAEGVKKYLSTISPATIKMLKQELGIDEGATFGGSVSVTTTANKFAEAMTLDDNQNTKEEKEDIAAFEADGDTLTEDQVGLVDFLLEQFPSIRSFSLLFSSRWNLRERLILRLRDSLEEKYLFEGGAPLNSTGPSKLTASNIQANNNTFTAAANASLTSQPNADQIRSPTNSARPPKPVVKRFLQKDDESDEDDNEKNNNRSKTSEPGMAKANSSLGGPADVGATSSCTNDAPSIVTSAQLGAIVGICEKGFTDSVPAVAAAALRLLRVALSGYRSDKLVKTPGTATPLEGSTRKGLPPRVPSTSSIRSGGTTNSPTDSVPTDLHLLVPRVVSLTSGSVTAESALDVLALMAGLPFITLNGALKDIVAMDDIKNVAKASVKAICARLDSASHLLSSVPNDKNIDISNLVQFATAAFQHREPKARTSAATLVVEIYKRVGDRIQPFLEPIKGAVGDDLRAKMAKITLREKQMSGASSRVRLAVFGMDGGAASGNVLLSPTASALSPSPPRQNKGISARSAFAVEEEVGKPATSGAEMAQGKNRKGNLVFS